MSESQVMDETIPTRIGHSLHPSAPKEELTVLAGLSHAQGSVRLKAPDVDYRRSVLQLLKQGYLGMYLISTTSVSEPISVAG